MSFPRRRESTLTVIPGLFYGGRTKSHNTMLLPLPKIHKGLSVQRVGPVKKGKMCPKMYIHSWERAGFRRRFLSFPRRRESTLTVIPGLFYGGRNKSHDTMLLPLPKIHKGLSVQRVGPVKKRKMCPKMYIHSWERAVFEEAFFVIPAQAGIHSYGHSGPLLRWAD